MAKSDDPSTEKEIWGTCEELLLACAVDRHGTHSWDSVATEIRSRSPYAHGFTALECKNRFLLLKSRFDGGDRGDENPTVEIPWLDKLRKLRVDELRRELRRHDASIGSLELKVKRLKEERERSLKKSDADDCVNGSGSGSEANPKEKNDRAESPRRSAANLAGDRISGSDSGRSSKESNYTEPNVEVPKVEEEDRIKEAADRAVIGSRSGSVNESVAESKEEGTKESSDVQSSASLSRRRRRRSAVDSAASAESQPLIDFLEIIRSNKDGSVFNRRLESQESVRYNGLIRRHVDLEVVRHRIGANGYTSAEFFRDLLLLCNNALAFYPKDSPESISAVRLRDLINKEIAAKLRKTPQPSPQSTKEPTPPPPLPSAPASKLKLDLDAEKATSAPPLVACRKRSSIAAKPAKHVKPGKKAEEEEEEEEEKVEMEEEEIEKDEVGDKKSTKQRTALSRKSRTGKGGANVVRDPRPEPVEQETKPSTKKRGAANFLNRIKLSPPSSNGKGNEMTTAKSSPSLSKGGGEQQKKKQEESKKQSIAAAAAASKRNVGRPPKRGLAPSGKRAREEKTPTPPPPPRKRGRR